MKSYPLTPSGFFHWLADRYPSGCWPILWTALVLELGFILGRVG